MKRLLLFVTVLCGLLTVSTHDFFRSSKTAHAKGKPGPKWDVWFVSEGGFGDEVVMATGVPGESDSNYRTGFGTGNVVVTVPDPENANQTIILDDKPFMIRGTVNGQDILSFRVGIKDGHPNKDRYAAEFTFPTQIGDPGNGEPWLEEVEGSVDPETLELKPGARVILHLHQGALLKGLDRTNDDVELGPITIGDIEFSAQ